MRAVREVLLAGFITAACAPAAPPPDVNPGPRDPRSIPTPAGPGLIIDASPRPAEPTIVFLPTPPKPPERIIESGWQSFTSLTLPYSSALPTNRWKPATTYSDLNRAAAIKELGLDGADPFANNEPLVVGPIHLTSNTALSVKAQPHKSSWLTLDSFIDAKRNEVLGKKATLLTPEQFPEKRQIDGNPARLLSYKGTSTATAVDAEFLIYVSMGGVPVETVEYYVLRDGKLWQFSFYTVKTGPTQERADFVKFLDAVRFVKK